MFLGIDGCFKTKLKDRGITDPDLGTGLAYMVNDMDYAAHLEEATEPKLDKVSTRRPRHTNKHTNYPPGRVRLAARPSTLSIRPIHETPKATS